MCLQSHIYVQTKKIFNLPFSVRKDEESYIAVLVTIDPHWRECRHKWVSRASDLQLRSSLFDTGKDSQYQDPTCSWKTVMAC